MHRHQRAERVAVGVLVRDEHEARRVAQLVEDLLAGIGLDRAHACSSMSRSRRCARSAVSSWKKVSVGVCLRRSSLPTRPCRKPWADRRPSSEALDGLGVPENAHVDASVAQIRAGLDIRDGHKSDPRVLHFMGEHVAENLSHGLIDSTHPLHAHPIPPASSNEVRLRSTRTPSG